ncbi:hypothetical protein H105_01823 [Trichophyton soudanense CBS 452.61]|uniref:Alpha-1,2-mannosyltransferase n=2 Tax=Trichophyton TaxID=5550 RepID=A0A178FRD4_TRIVO|nr:hypothetical protein H105_01823 [Trichophyton soudanense CBS 452.61]EZG09493.1 hypothetical protein H106_01669 [Trichophyton rubrum CBS 735.88]OAL74117.1 hypothetical protein A7D00_2148 [Trichophyton violaceum]
MMSLRTRLRLAVSAGIVLILLLYLSNNNWTVPALGYHKTPVHAPSKPIENSPQLHASFWSAFQPVLERYAPTCQPPKKEGRADTSEIGFHPERNDQKRPDHIRMPAADVLSMKKLHTDFVVEANSGRHRPYYAPSTRGLVSTAGGPYLPVLTVSLRMLRNRGCSLPMEVFLATNAEFEPYICNQVFPALQAKCVVLENMFKTAPKGISISNYQYKIFAMLFSSFEELLFLDADAFPLHDPNELFHKEPFSSGKMVFFPDFWASSAAQQYYTIASLPAPNMNKRASTESGEIMLSKKHHAKTLLLAAYYNLYGPQYFYPLLSQGAAGEGDKETFLAAATVVEDDFYQVSERLRAIGHRSPAGLAGSAMIQFDPTEDYVLTQKGLWRVLNDSVAPPPRPFFVHVNVPKFNPATIFGKHPIDPVRDHTGKFIRPWSVPVETIKLMGDGIEKQFWSEMKWVACELEKKFKSWEKIEGVCDNMKKYWNEVFEKQQPKQ